MERISAHVSPACYVTIRYHTALIFSIWYSSSTCPPSFLTSQARYISLPFNFLPEILCPADAPVSFCLGQSQLELLWTSSASLHHFLHRNDICFLCNSHSSTTTGTWGTRPWFFPYSHQYPTTILNSTALLCERDRGVENKQEATTAPRPASESLLQRHFNIPQIQSTLMQCFSSRTSQSHTRESQSTYFFPILLGK